MSTCTTSPRLSGIVQPPPLTADRTVSCHHWWLSWRLQIPTYWNIGAYVAVLTTADGYRSHVPFTVRDNHPADLLREILRLDADAKNDLSERGVERVGVVTDHLFRARRISGVYLPVDDLTERSLPKAYRDLQKQKTPETPDENDEGVVKELQQI